MNDFDVPSCIWGNDENNGVDAKNVSLNNGILEIKIDETNRKGGAIESKNYYDHGSFEMEAMSSGVSGICFAMWTFYYADNGNINDEIDIEFYGTQNGDNNIIYSSYVSESSATHINDKLSYGISDGKYHKYRFDWHSDRVEYFVDDVKVETIRENVPTHEMKWWIGAWCPSWAGENIEGEYKMLVRSLSYKPFN